MTKYGKVVVQLPDQEVAICKRLKELRIKNSLNQSEIARDVLGIPPERYRSYEYYRAPIKYELADRICKEFGINQAWLAIGNKPLTPYIQIPDEIVSSIKPNALFSEVFKNQLRATIDNLVKSDYIEAKATIGTALSLRRLLVDIKESHRALPVNKKSALRISLQKALDQFSDKELNS